MIEVLTNEGFLMLLAIWMVAAVGMNLVYVTGQLNLGQAGFLAVGAYTLAVVDATWSWPLPLSLLAGAVAAGIVAFPVAVGANRVRGIYLIMGTLAVGEVVQVTISNLDAVGGAQGYLVPLPRLSLGAVVATVTVVVAAATVLMATPIGLTMRSIFDDEDAAAAAGVPTRRMKIAAVILSAAVVGVAGGLLAKYQTFIAPRHFGVSVSFEIALFTLIGGTHSLLGALVGAFAVTYLLEVLASVEDIGWVPASLYFLAPWRSVVYGVLVMALMAVLPEGLISRRFALRLTAPARAVVRRIMLRNDAARPVTAVEPARPGGRLLEVDGVSHRFGGVQALDDVTFSVDTGEILALVGANGAGKSTLIDVVAGRYRCQQGSIRLEEQELTGLRPEARVRAGVTRTFQSVRMFRHLTVEEVVRLGRGAARHRRPPGVNEVLALVDLEGRREDLPGSLTLAEQRRLEVGRAVASAPAIVLLDEPSVGMNLEERTELADLVRAIRDRGTTVVVVDHNLDLVQGVADRVVVLDFGRVLAVGPPDQVFGDPRVRAAYIGPIVPSTGLGQTGAAP